MKGVILSRTLMIRYHSIHIQSMYLCSLSTSGVRCDGGKQALAQALAESGRISL